MDLILNLVAYFIGTFLLVSSVVYCWKSLLEENFILSKRKFVAIVTFMSIVETTFNFLLPKSLKFICTFIFLISIAYYLLDKKIVKAMMIVAISQLIIFGAECIFVIAGHCFFHYEVSELNKLSTSLYGGLILNIHIALVSSLFVKTGLPKKLYNALYSLTSVTKNKNVVIYLSMIFIIMITSVIESCISMPLYIVFTTDTILTIIFVYMVVKFANSENNYNQMNIKYRTSLSSLREYGDMINKYRITNHENQNQLLTIQNMTDDENVIRYIESLLKEKKNTNNKIMNKIIKIPEGEVRSLIHAKLSKINELGIKYKLDISKDVKTTSLIDLNDDLKRDTCTILGVFLDNAIEGVKDLKKRRIIIEFYIMDNFLYIDITNNFEGTIDAESLSNIGYTTKGEGHGYGLTLVDKIVKDNNDIEHECEIIKDNITQRVIIKM